MNRHALLSLGLLVTGIAVASPGCGGDSSSGDNGNEAGDTSAAGKDAGAGENAGGTGNVVKPSAGAGGEGGAAQAHGGAGGVPEGGVSAGGAGAGGVAPGAGGAGGAGGENGNPPGCDVPRSFGKLGLLDGSASEFGEELPGAGWEAVLPVLPDGETVLHVDVYDNYGPFVPVRKPLTNYELAGDDLNNGSCGVCVYIRQLSGLSEKRYFVTGGTITVSGTGGVDGRVTGNASNLTFEEVTLDDNLYSVPVPDGCKSRISSVSFDAATGGVN